MYLAIVASFVISASLLTINVAQPVKADPNCDKVGLDFNKAGNVKGNGNCQAGADSTPPEPQRDCSVKGDFHKNFLKDNDGDIAAGCVFRGK